MLTHLVDSNEITDSINWVAGCSWAGCWITELSGYGAELPGGEEREGDLLGLGLCNIYYSQGPKCVIFGYYRTAYPQVTGTFLSTLQSPNTYTCNEVSNLPSILLPGVCVTSSCENTQ